MADANTAQSISCYGDARSTISNAPLSDTEIQRMEEYFNASLYLCLGMLYLKDNPLLREPLRLGHLKKRLLGHWGSAPGQVFAYMHFNRIIKKHDVDAIFISGPGHGAPAVLSQAYLEGTYSEVFTEVSEDVDGMRRLFSQFSFPGGVGSHATPETPGSLHEGGELGYSISHAFGAVYDNPKLVALTMVGDGESETGPLATSWHSNKFLNPATDGAVLPVLHLNGYKINNPTILARISHEELAALFQGYGWNPYFVEGSDLDSMHQAMAATLDKCMEEIRDHQARAAATHTTSRPRWPMVILRTPKGWTAPRKINNNFLEGYWRAHQIPITDVLTNHESLSSLEAWLRSYRPETLFDETGKLRGDLRDLAPEGNRRMSANPVANGGTLRKPLKMPDFRSFAVSSLDSGVTSYGAMTLLGTFLRDVIKANPTNFRLFGPDETESNKLAAVYECTQKVWMGEIIDDDHNGGNLATDGRVMEMLSEHTVEGWLEGYLLSGRHGLLNSYEPFIHIIDSMVGQHCKWIEKCLEVEWRAKISSLNILLTATVWRQDHNGFTHQDPGFLDVVCNKSPDVVRVYLPPDANCLLSVADHCLRSVNYVNVIVADKQNHIQYLDMETAIAHCTKGMGIWDWASNDQGCEPDVVMACCGDVSTYESLAATALLREHLSGVKIRFVNVVDLFSLISRHEHSHGFSDVEFRAVFTDDKPVIFNFHSYPWLVHRLTYKRKGQNNFHVTGYREKGNINTPLELAIRNGTDRYSLAIDAIDRMSGLGNRSSATRQYLVNRRVEAKNYAFEHGVDPESVTSWTWPFKPLNNVTKS